MAPFGNETRIHSLDLNMQIVQAAMELHNFCIENDSILNDIISYEESNAIAEVVRICTYINWSNRQGIPIDYERSTVRAPIIDKISELWLVRPA